MNSSRMHIKYMYSQRKMASTLINFHAIAVDNFIRADKGIMEV